MKWKNHIQDILDKTRCMIFSFLKLRDILPIKYLITVYKVLFIPIWSYAITVWGGTYEGDITPIEILNRKILKIILNKPRRYSTHKLYEEIKIMDINKTCAANILKFSLKKQLIHY